MHRNVASSFKLYLTILGPDRSKTIEQLVYFSNLSIQRFHDISIAQMDNRREVSQILSGITFDRNKAFLCGENI